MRNGQQGFFFVFRAETVHVEGEDGDLLPQSVTWVDIESFHRCSDIKRFVFIEDACFLGRWIVGLFWGTFPALVGKIGERGWVLPLPFSFCFPRGTFFRIHICGGGGCPIGDTLAELG